MSKREQLIAQFAALAFICGLGIWFLCSRGKREHKTNQNEDFVAHVETDTSQHDLSLKFKEMSRKPDPNFPINDKIELPFLGKIECHARQQSVTFIANGLQKEWPFTMYYLPNGMFVRAEFAKPGAKNYENDPKFLTELYRSSSESMAGFPDKPAPADLGKVLQSLYAHAPFDRATKLNITWVLWENADREILPRYIVDVFGVSPGLMRVPDNSDEAFLKYRVFLTPDGVAVMTDNAL